MDPALFVNSIAGTKMCGLTHDHRLPMIETVKMFDYWAFHDDGRVQFFQICEGEIMDYREYACPEDAPVIKVNVVGGIIGPVRDLRYHGRSYVAPVARRQE